MIIKIYSRDKRLAIKTELQIRKKAISNEDFPPEDIIDEFMRKSNNPKAMNLEWCQPNIIKFIVSIKYSILLLISKLNFFSE